ncbi:MAG: YbjN domain-containing protein [Calditrichaceae bacterium]|nr:YbjN domain-containing protein [Calditrichia bacterium]NUQ41604.1 YbjN domain-containing protein [Calditrichaceae bacterium]
MADELITPENLSVDLLKAIFDAAYMNFSVEEGKELKVKDSCTVWVSPDLERKNRIRLYAIFAFKESSSQSDRLECVNRINNEYIMIRASVTDKGLLFFEYDLMLDGGLTKKALVSAIKRFASIPHGAVEEHGASIVE